MLLYLHCLTRKNQYMTRQERTKSGTGIYHVMLRGINRQDIFEDAEDYLQMVACLRGLTERYDESGVAVEPLCTIYSYCLMSNHLHLLNDHRTVPWFLISKELKGVSVYAPNDDLSIKGDGQTKVYNNNSWVEFRDNQQVRRYDADQQPGSVSFDAKYDKWGKSELIDKDKLVPWE